jgi:hypothetical protein
MRPNRRFSSATSACNCSIVRACASISAHNSSRDGCSDPDTAHDHHTSRPRSRSDTPQDRRPRPEWLPPTTLPERARTGINNVCRQDRLGGLLHEYQQVT